MQECAEDLGEIADRLTATGLVRVYIWTSDMLSYLACSDISI